MPPVVKQKKPSKLKGYQKQVLVTEGKLYRVRDKDWGDGDPVRVWGENLAYEDACQLKEKVVGSNKSRTARVEEMSVPAPETAAHASSLVTAPDKAAGPVIESVQRKALAAAGSAAQQAQQRANQLAARRKLEAQASTTPKPRPQPRGVAPVMKLVDDEETVPEIADEDEMGDLDDEVTEAEMAADADADEYEKKGRALYAAYGLVVKGAPTTEPAWRGHDLPAWDDLGPVTQAALSFEAAGAIDGRRIGSDLPYLSLIWNAHHDAQSAAALESPCVRCNVGVGQPCHTAEVTVSPVMGDKPRKVAISSTCASRIPPSAGVLTDQVKALLGVFDPMFDPAIREFAEAQVDGDPGEISGDAGGAASG